MMMMDTNKMGSKLLSRTGRELSGRRPLGKDRRDRKQMTMRRPLWKRRPGWVTQGFYRLCRRVRMLF